MLPEAVDAQASNTLFFGSRTTGCLRCTIGVGGSILPSCNISCKHTPAQSAAERSTTSRHKSIATTVASRAAATISTATLLGDSAVETHVDSLKAGHAKAFSFQASVSGSSELAHVYVDSHNAARTLTVGLYSNVAGSPGLVVEYGNDLKRQAGRWNTVSLAPTALARRRNLLACSAWREWHASRSATVALGRA